MAAFITSYTGYILVSFLPPILWLMFYLREDRHPEPKRLLILVFLGGMGSAVAAVSAELFLIGTKQSPGIFALWRPDIFSDFIFLFSVIALVEEYCKYLAVKFLVLRNPEFDEPIDAMIYMITSALGFAALENAFFLVPVLRDSPALGLQLTANRFIGANLLHALSSAIVGYFLARALFSPYRKHFIALGIFTGALLHFLFNYFIIIKDAVPESLVLLVVLLFVMAFMVFVDFEKLKQVRS